MRASPSELHQRRVTERKRERGRMGHPCAPLHLHSPSGCHLCRMEAVWEGVVEKAPTHSLPCQTVPWSLAEAHRADGEAKLLCEVPAVGGHRHVPERKEVQVLLELQHSLTWGGVLFQSRLIQPTNRWMQQTTNADYIYCLFSF